MAHPSVASATSAPQSRTSWRLCGFARARRFARLPTPAPALALALAFALALIVSHAFFAPSASADTVTDRHDDLTIEYVPADAARAAKATALYRDARARVERRLGLDVPRPPFVFIAPSEISFEKRVRSVAFRSPPRWALAVAIPSRDLIVFRGPALDAGRPEELDVALAHEVAHLVLGPVSRRRGRPIPHWLEEGLASWASELQQGSDERAEVRGRARAGTLIALRDLEAGFPSDPQDAHLAYAQTQAFVEFLAERGGGDAAIRELILGISRGYTTDGASREVIGDSLVSLEAEFAHRLAEERWWWLDALLQVTVFHVMGALAVLAIVRYIFKRRRLLREMAEAEGEAA